MAPDAAPALVSINIPCYQQPDYARRAVSALLDQTFQDFVITLLDDGASAEYETLARSFNDRRVRYVPNPKRLGAMANMFQAIACGESRYVLAFHEDDLVSRGFLAAAVAILETRPDCAFVCAELREFPHDCEPSPVDLARVCACPEFVTFQSPADLLRGVLRGIEPMFGSVVYRRSALEGVAARHEAFATLVDRPFLLALLGRGAGAVLREPLAWYRGDRSDQNRHSAMRADHIVRLFELYKATLPQPLSPQDAAAFFTYSGYWLFRLYDLTPVDSRPPLREFLFRVWRDGLYEPKWRGRFGLRLLARALAGRSATG